MVTIPTCSLQTEGPRYFVVHNTVTGSDRRHQQRKMGIRWSADWSTACLWHSGGWMMPLWRIFWAHVRYNRPWLKKWRCGAKPRGCGGKPPHQSRWWPSVESRGRYYYEIGSIMHSSRHLLSFLSMTTYTRWTRFVVEELIRKLECRRLTASMLLAQRHKTPQTWHTQISRTLPFNHRYHQYPKPGVLGPSTERAQQSVVAK